MVVMASVICEARRSSTTGSYVIVVVSALLVHTRIATIGSMLGSITMLLATKSDASK